MALIPNVFLPGLLVRLDVRKIPLAGNVFKSTAMNPKPALSPAVIIFFPPKKKSMLSATTSAR